jgi:hypothetical protein
VGSPRGSDAQWVLLLRGEEALGLGEDYFLEFQVAGGCVESEDDLVLEVLLDREAKIPKYRRFEADGEKGAMMEPFEKQSSVTESIEMAKSRRRYGEKDEPIRLKLDTLTLRGADELFHPGKVL